MEIAGLIRHPERLDRDTLYELRSLIALYPSYQTARLLMLQNLYLLHDPTFDEELRRAAIYITDRRALFQMIEAPHYQLRPGTSGKTGAPAPGGSPQSSAPSRTITLIDSFLGSIPADDEAPTQAKRKPTPADAAVDYVAYLLDIEAGQPASAAAGVPEMKGQELIDTFINHDKGKFSLRDVPLPATEPEPKHETAEEVVEEEYFTETLARIYIKQGRYSKALEIIQRLSLQIPKKNAYFADQIRFLEKLIVNNNNK